MRRRWRVDWRWRRWIRHLMYDSLKPTKSRYEGSNEGIGESAVWPMYSSVKFKQASIATRFKK
jgi:hypothetical protein